MASLKARIEKLEREIDQEEESDLILVVEMDDHNEITRRWRKRRPDEIGKHGIWVNWEGDDNEPEKAS